MDDAELDRLWQEMAERRQEWRRAAADFGDALKLFRDTGAGPDGSMALRDARRRDAETLAAYTAALRSYSDAILRSKKRETPEKE